MKVYKKRVNLVLQHTYSISENSTCNVYDAVHISMENSMCCK